MKKYLKYAYVACAGVLVSVFGSCTNDYEYNPATVEGQQVYFSNELPSRQDLDSKASSFTFQLNRVKTDGELTVKLDTRDENSLFSVPEQVTFANGANTVDVTVGYDAAQFTYDDYKDVVVALADVSYTTPYGMSSYSFSAGVPSPYVSLGVGHIVDAFSMENLEGYDVEIMQNTEQPNVFRVMHPYDEAIEAEAWSTQGNQCEYIQFTIMQPGMSIGDVPVTMSDLVYFPDFNTGFYNTYNDYNTDIKCYHPNDLGLDEEAYWTYNRVLSYQESGLPGQVQLAPVYWMDGLGGWNYSQQDGDIIITFPGYDPKDYTVSVDYVGALAAKDENTYALAKVSMGADVDEVKLAIVEGNNPDLGLNGILDGSVQIVTVTESGEVRIPCDYSGVCTIVAVSYAGGEPQDYSYVTINFTLSKSPWRSIGTGGFTDFVITQFLVDENDNPLQPISFYCDVQESTETPGLYRFVNPYSPEVYPLAIDGLDYDDSEDHYIYVNAENPDYVFIELQKTGAYVSSLGNFYLATLPGYYYGNGYTIEEISSKGIAGGTLAEGLFTFPIDNCLFSADALDGLYYANSEAPVYMYLPEALASGAKSFKVPARKIRTKMGKTTKAKQVNKKQLLRTMNFTTNVRISE
ncbi:MAG: hypothetical protein ACI350_01195 [Prevotella sp.]